MTDAGIANRKQLVYRLLHFQLKDCLHCLAHLMVNGQCWWLELKKEH